jgi:hypothetical protein
MDVNGQRRTCIPLLLGELSFYTLDGKVKSVAKRKENRSCSARRVILLTENTTSLIPCSFIHDFSTTGYTWSNRSFMCEKGKVVPVLN